MKRHWVILSAICAAGLVSGLTLYMIYKIAIMIFQVVAILFMYT